MSACKDWLDHQNARYDQIAASGQPTWLQILKVVLGMLFLGLSVLFLFVGGTPSSRFMTVATCLVSGVLFINEGAQILRRRRQR